MEISKDAERIEIQLVTFRLHCTHSINTRLPTIEHNSDTTHAAWRRTTQQSDLAATNIKGRIGSYSGRSFHEVNWPHRYTGGGGEGNNVSRRWRRWRCAWRGKHHASVGSIDQACDCEFKGGRTTGRWRVELQPRANNTASRAGSASPGAPRWTSETGGREACNIAVQRVLSYSKHHRRFSIWVEIFD